MQDGIDKIANHFFFISTPWFLKKGKQNKLKEDCLTSLTDKQEKQDQKRTSICS